MNFPELSSNFWNVPPECQGEKKKKSSKAAGELMDLSFPEKGKQGYQPFVAPE